MQYFHDRLVANGIDPAEIKGKVSIETRDVLLFTQSMQYSYFDHSRTKGPGESYIKLEIGSLHPTEVNTNGIPDLTTIIATMIVTEEAKKFTISIAAQELKSDGYESGGKVVLNEKGRIVEVKEIPPKNEYMPRDIRAVLKKRENYQTAINALVDHFCEHYIPDSKHRLLWKDKGY